MPFTLRGGAARAAVHSFAPLALAAFAATVSAQEAADASATADSSAVTRSRTLHEVTVTGNPLGGRELIAPATQLSGDELTLKRQSTLGETLDGTPGVSSTYFGPNASRPVIRGLDGDRIRVLQNAGASIDASGLSFDHAVPIDPLVIERIEVLRGPGALLYGGSAVGGVVNTIDHRIHGEPLFDAAGGVSGRAEVRLGGAAQERGGAALLETGTDRFSLHVDAFKRNTSDTRVPTDLACSKPGSPALASRICNSQSSSDGLALGGTLLFDNGYLGLSTNSFSSRYGTVAEDDVSIDMRSRRTALEGQWRNLPGPIASIKLQAGHTDYQHTEFEGDEVGTVFRNRGNDLRIEAKQATWGRLDGVVGLQTENTRFSADGEEAFAPRSRTRQQALFAYEELGMDWGKLSFGGRMESVRVESFGNPDVARFATGGVKFNPRSFATGALVKLGGPWSLTGNLASSQRAPRDYELFANGPHVATAAYEVGNPNLREEKSTNLDAGLAWKSGANRAEVSAFVNRFRNYISLEATGNVRGADGGAPAPGEEALAEYIYRPVRARFRGLEASGNWRLLDRGPTLDFEWRGDVVRADNLDTGEPLPRIAPVRVGGTLVLGQGAWKARLGVDRAARQSRVPAGQLPTDGYTLVNASLTYSAKAGPTHMLWFARLDNLTDRLAYSATSVLTQTVPGKVPLPGRGLQVGLQVSF